MSNMFNEFIIPVTNQQTTAVTVFDPSTLVTKSDLNEIINRLNEKIDKVRQNSISKKNGEIGNLLRINRPLKWKYNWRGEKKYAVLGKEQLEYWNKNHMAWQSVAREEGGEQYLRFPGCWD